MGTSPASQPAETLVQLMLRARYIDALVQNAEDWRVLGLIAARMLFWCGGAIYACRCEGREMRFALQVVHAPLGTIAHQIAGAYATHLRKTRKLRGAIFRHYAVIPLHDSILLGDLVLWLHRPDEPITSSAMVVPRRDGHVWTSESAYLVANSLPWIDTDRVLSALGAEALGSTTYTHRKAADMSAHAVDLFSRRQPHVRRKDYANNGTQMVGPADCGAQATRPSIETIARLVADYCEVSYEDMLTDTRKRAVTKARVLATVLATRQGATAAATARLFKRSRSTLCEQVEHYRASQPEIFAEAQCLLEALLVDVGDSAMPAGSQRT